MAAILAVVALPSLPTRRVAVVMLGLAGLGALRHAALPTTDSMLIVLWAGATLVALVLIDRAQAERIPQLAQGHPLGPRVPEALRVAALVAAIVVAVAVAVVPTVTDHVGRRMWPGTLPSLGDGNSAPGSLRTTPRLDMTSRPRLSDRVVFTVDAPRADFWRGEVFDAWDGQSSWTRSDEGRAARLQREGNTYQLQPDPYDVGAMHGTAMRQTFHIETGVSEVLFAAPSAVSVESDRIILGHADGTAAVLGEFGKDAVYTVVSKSSLADGGRPARGRAARRPACDRAAVRGAARRLHHASAPSPSRSPRTHPPPTTRSAPSSSGCRPTPGTRCRRRCRRVAPTSSTTSSSRRASVGASRCRAAWRSSPRSVGIPARLATGFVPGEKDGLSGHFVVRERDAHAWTEIYFPGIGWQGFDPTASVPLAGEARPRGFVDGRSARPPRRVRDRARSAGVAGDLGAEPRRRGSGGASAGGRPGRAARSAGSNAWARRPGRARAPAETPREYAHTLADRLEEPRLDTVGEVIDRDEFAAAGADPAARAAADAVLDELLAAHHGRRTVAAEPRVKTANSRAGDCYPRRDREGDPERSLRRRWNARATTRPPKTRQPIRPRRGPAVLLSGSGTPGSGTQVLRTRVFDAADLRRAVTRIAHEIVERNHGAQDTVLVGMYTRGVALAHRIGAAITSFEAVEVPTGTLDVAFYRDDIGLRPVAPLGPTEVPDITDRVVVLVDDVLFTGRTARAALDALLELGRPRAVQFAVLVDRGHRELPIRADYVGKNLPTKIAEDVRVRLTEVDGTPDAVEIWGEDA